MLPEYPMQPSRARARRPNDEKVWAAQRFLAHSVSLRRKSSGNARSRVSKFFLDSIDCDLSAQGSRVEPGAAAARLERTLVLICFRLSPFWKSGIPVSAEIPT